MKSSIKPASSLLAKIEVAFLDDRDPRHSNRWKVYPIRRQLDIYEIQIKGVWVECCSGFGHFAELWERKGYASTQYGLLHQDPAKTAGAEYGMAHGMAFRGSADSLAEIAACAVLGIHWPVEVDELKAAYRSLVKSAHPDTGGDAERFCQIQEAYETLRSKLHDS